MAPPRPARIAAGVATCLTVAAIFSLSPPKFDSPASAEPSPRAPSNTGAPAGPGFLIDFRQGPDRKTHYLADYEMNEDWIKIAYSPRNIRFGKDGMTLELIKTGGKLPFSGSEWQRNGTFGYGRYEAVLTASGDPGAVTSFFTYTGGYWGDPHDEIDFEFVASKPREVHLNYFRGGKDDATDIPLWFDTSKADHLYTFEWSPDSIRWYVDGVKIHEVTTATARAGIPTTTGRVIANLWAGSGAATGWTGEPRFIVTRAAFRCISHVPAGQAGAQCSDTFKPPKR
jgi:endo-1,3-1,4-beta-glycanase ExoK